MTNPSCACRDPRLGQYQCSEHNPLRSQGLLGMRGDAAPRLTGPLPKRVCADPDHVQGPTACWECGGLSSHQRPRILDGILSGDSDIAEGLLS